MSGISFIANVAGDVVFTITWDPEGSGMDTGVTPDKTKYQVTIDGTPASITSIGWDDPVTARFICPHAPATVTILCELIANDVDTRDSVGSFARAPQSQLHTF